MLLKDSISQARSETKEKILTIGFLEKEKATHQSQVEELKENMKKVESYL